MEKRKEVKPVKVIYLCDRCKSGEMVPTGQIFNLGKTQLEHVCPVCGYRKSFTEQYPKIEYVEVSEEDK